MGTKTLAGIGKILSGSSTVSAEGKTLIITAHGRMTGADFTKPYYAAVSYASPAYGALLADLNDAIDGKVTGAELATTGTKEKEHALAYYESDPSDGLVVAKLNGKSVDVLKITDAITSTRATGAPTLSGVMQALKQAGLEYPQITCLFCRVVKEVSTGQTLMGYDVTGGQHKAVAEQTSKMKDAIAIGQALKKKFASQ